jgi:hypothetical protein
MQGVLVKPGDDRRALGKSWGGRTRRNIQQAIEIDPNIPDSASCAVNGMAAEERAIMEKWEDGITQNLWRTSFPLQSA